MSTLVTNEDASLSAASLRVKKHIEILHSAENVTGLLPSV